MGTIAGYFASNISSRAISISTHWVRRNSPIVTCIRSKDYASSSAPIRYIPKIASKPCNDVKSSPFDSEIRVFDKVLKEENVPNQRKICQETSSVGDAQQGLKEVTNHMEVVQPKFVEEPKEFIDTGIQNERDIRRKSAIAGRTIVDAEKMAIELLATRAFTAVELRKKLQGKKFPLDIVDAVIVDFQSRGLINDGFYAEIFSRSRWSSSTWGPRRIKQALFRKGVSEADVEKAVKLVFHDDEFECLKSEVGISKLSMEHLLVQTSKQWLRGQDVSKETRKARIIRWLQYRGFNWGVISFILKKLESQHSS